MFSWYKKYKVKMIEKELHRIIRYNKYVIEEYKAYPNKVPVDKKLEEEFSEIHAICMGYDKDLWKKFEKYGVNERLFNEQLKTEEEALHLYRTKKKEKERITKEKEERVKIDLYKKAILELKNEGKL